MQKTNNRMRKKSKNFVKRAHRGKSIYIYVPGYFKDAVVDNLAFFGGLYLSSYLCINYTRLIRIGEFIEKPILEITN